MQLERKTDTNGKRPQVVSVTEPKLEGIAGEGGRNFNKPPSGMRGPGAKGEKLRLMVQRIGLSGGKKRISIHNKKTRLRKNLLFIEGGDFL